MSFILENFATVDDDTIEESTGSSSSAPSNQHDPSEVGGNRIRSDSFANINTEKISGNSSSDSTNHHPPSESRGTSTTFADDNTEESTGSSSSIPMNKYPPILTTSNQHALSGVERSGGSNTITIARGNTNKLAERSSSAPNNNQHAPSAVGGSLDRFTTGANDNIEEPTGSSSSTSNNHHSSSEVGGSGGRSTTIVDNKEEPTGSSVSASRNQHISPIVIGSEGIKRILLCLFCCKHVYWGLLIYCSFP